MTTITTTPATLHIHSWTGINANEHPDRITCDPDMQHIDYAKSGEIDIELPDGWEIARTNDGTLAIFGDRGEHQQIMYRHHSAPRIIVVGLRGQRALTIISCTPSP